MKYYYCAVINKKKLNCYNNINIVWIMKLTSISLPQLKWLLLDESFKHGKCLLGLVLRYLSRVKKKVYYND